MSRAIVILLIAVIAPAMVLAYLAIEGVTGDLEAREAAIRADAERAFRQEAGRIRSILAERVQEAMARLERGAADPPIFAGPDGIPFADPSAFDDASGRERSLWERAVSGADALAFSASDPRAGRDTLSDALASVGDPNLRADLLTRIARCFAREGDRGSAREVLEHIAATYPEAISPEDGLPLGVLADVTVRRSDDGARGAGREEDTVSRAPQGPEAPAPRDPDPLLRRLWRLRHRLRPAAIRSATAWIETDPPPELARYVREREAIERAFATAPRPFRGEPFVARGTLFLFRSQPGRPPFAGTCVPLRVEPELAGTVLRVRFFPGAREPAPDGGEERLAAGPVRITVRDREIAAGSLAVDSPEIGRLRAAAGARRGRVRATAAVLGVLLLGAAWGLVLAVRRERALLAFRALLVDHVSHEIRTPASAIAALAELLARDELGPEESRRYRRLLAAEARRLGFVVENVIDASRPHDDRSAPEREPLDAAALLRDLVEALRPRFDEEGVALRVEIEALPPIRSDRRAVARIVYNLLDNALKYRSRERPPRVELRARAAQNGRIEIEVADNGRGIPRDLARRIFDPFARGEPAIPGTGVGLAIARRLAGGLGGELRLEVHAGEGSAFRLILPARAGEDATSGHGTGEREEP